MPDKTWWDLSEEERLQFAKKVRDVKVHAWENLKQAAYTFGLEPDEDMPTMFELCYVAEHISVDEASQKDNRYTIAVSPWLFSYLYESFIGEYADLDLSEIPMGCLKELRQALLSADEAHICADEINEKGGET